MRFRTLPFLPRFYGLELTWKGPKESNDHIRAQLDRSLTTITRPSFSHLQYYFSVLWQPLWSPYSYLSFNFSINSSLSSLELALEYLKITRTWRKTCNWLWIFPITGIKPPLEGFCGRKNFTTDVSWGLVWCRPWVRQKPCVAILLDFSSF